MPQLFKLQAAQRQHALKLRSFPPLSPQESCTLSFSDSSSSSPQLARIDPPFRCLPQYGELHRHSSTRQGVSSFFSNVVESSSPTSCVQQTAYHAALPFVQKSNKGTSGAELPLVCCSLAEQGTLRSKMIHKLDEDGRASADSKRLKRTLEDLEKELMGDDSDIATCSFMPEMATNSFCSSMVSSTMMLDASKTPSFGAEPAADERDWTDLFEDFLTAESSSPTTTIDQSTVTSFTSNASNLITHQYTAQSPGSTPRHPKELLLACANAINNEDYAMAKVGLSSLEQYVSIYGDPMQRVAAHMAEGLAARMELVKDGYSNRLSQITGEASPAEMVQSMQVLYQSCLYFKFGYLAANASIAEACRNERRIHIIDFNLGQGNQWQTLIGAFAQRLGGPPHIRITGVADPKSPASVIAVGRNLEELARRAKVPFEFKYLQMEASQVEPYMLQIQEGEALAVNLAFHLHRMADESVSTSNPRDRLLRKAKALQPKIVTLVEHDANTNTAPFYQRFVEALEHFMAIFESLDVALPRDSKERVNAEKYCLARDVMNVVACEGEQRSQRYEKAGKWRARMMMAGFRSLPASVHTNRLVKELLVPYSSKYKVREEAGALHLQWLERQLVVSSAWQ